MEKFTANALMTVTHSAIPASLTVGVVIASGHLCNALSVAKMDLLCVTSVIIGTIITGLVDYLLRAMDAFRGFL